MKLEEKDWAIIRLNSAQIQITCTFFKLGILLRAASKPTLELGIIKIKITANKL